MVVRLPDCSADDVNSDLLVLVGDGDICERGNASEKGHSAARNHAAFDRASSRIESIFYSIFLLALFDLAGTANFQSSNAVRKSGESLV
jgi:hypothetical protein